jgi:predicted amidohydrolase YtcJ
VAGARDDRRGALVLPASDWSVVPSVNPWIAVETLATREQPGGSEPSFGKPQAFSREEAIDMAAINAARHRQLEGTVGRIAPGMWTDVIIVSQDPFEVPVRKLRETQVLTTIINGAIVFQR